MGNVVPSISLKPCAEPNCSALVRGSSRCPVHTKAKERWRGSRHERGYDHAWVKLRDWFMAQPENVLCKMCLRHGRAVVATECDHIIPFQGKDDPRRLDKANLQGLCSNCHSAKHKK